MQTIQCSQKTIAIDENTDFPVQKGRQQWAQETLALVSMINWLYFIQKYCNAFKFDDE